MPGVPGHICGGRTHTDAHAHIHARIHMQPSARVCACPYAHADTRMCTCTLGCPQPLTDAFPFTLTRLCRAPAVWGAVRLLSPTYFPVESRHQGWKAGSADGGRTRLVFTNAGQSPSGCGRADTSERGVFRDVPPGHLRGHARGQHRDAATPRLNPQTRGRAARARGTRRGPECMLEARAQAEPGAVPPPPPPPGS